MSAHHVGLVAAGHPQPRDGVTGAVEDPRLRVGFQAGEGTEAAGQDFDRVERALLQWRERRVGAVVLVARALVERRHAPLELRVLTDPGVPVELRDRFLQLHRVDAAFARQLGEGRPLGQIAGANVGERRQRERLGHPERVFALEGVVADQPRLDRLVGGGGVEHPLGELVVAVRLVDEPLPGRQHRNQSRFAPVHDVRIHPDPAAAVRHQRHRAPRGRGRQVGVQHPTRGLTEGDAVAGGLCRGQGPVFVAGGCPREELGAALHVVGKPAGSQHHPVGRPHRDIPVRAVDHRAGHPAVLGGQRRDRGIRPQRDPELVGGFHQPRDQRRPVHQLHAVSVNDEVKDVERDPPRGVEETLDRCRGVQERLQVRAGHDPHPEERRLIHLRPDQFPQVFSEPALVERFRPDRPATRPGPGKITLDVGDPRAGHELQ